MEPIHLHDVKKGNGGAPIVALFNRLSSASQICAKKDRRFSHELDNLFGWPRRRSLVRSFVFWSAMNPAFVASEKPLKNSGASLWK
jgi:hypothetical protein